MPPEITTWDELRADLTGVKDTLAVAQQRAVGLLARPEWDDGGANYVRAYRAAYGGLEGALPRIEALVALLEASEPPPAPACALEAVQAGRIIEAAVRWAGRYDELPCGEMPGEESDELIEAVRAVVPGRTGPVRPLDQLADAFAARKPEGEPLARETRTIRGHEVEFELDDVLGTWRFRCPARHVIGGGQFTLRDAFAAAQAAIDFSLEPVPDEADSKPRDGGEEGA